MIGIWNWDCWPKGQTPVPVVPGLQLPSLPTQIGLPQVGGLSPILSRRNKLNSSLPKIPAVRVK